MQHHILGYLNNIYTEREENRKYQFLWTHYNIQLSQITDPSMSY